MKNKYEALREALTLAIIAPTEKYANELIRLAEDLSDGMPAKLVEKAKAEAEKKVRAMYTA